VSAAAFWILATVFAVRLYFVFRWQSSNAFLAATGVGVLGLFLTGAVVPEPAIDAALGGHNILHLVRNLCVTAAVWLVREGVFSAYSADENYRKQLSHRPVALGIIATAIAIPFTLQQFVPFTTRYLPDNLHQPAVFTYAVMYMGILGFLAMSVLKVCLHRQESRPVRVSAAVVATGMGLIVLACADEILFLSLEFLNAGSELTNILYVLFSPLFYAGVLLTSLGLGIPPIVKAGRQLQLWERTALLVLTLMLSRSYWQLSPTAWVRRMGESFSTGNPSGRLYEFMIRASDHRVALTGKPTPWFAGRVLTSVQSRFDGDPSSLQSELQTKVTP
jgi:hypothetical protein